MNSYNEGTVSLQSPVDAIENIWIYQLPSNSAVNAAKAIRIGRVTLVLGVNGKIYDNRAFSGAYLLLNASGDYVKALRKIGAITKEQHDQHEGRRKEIEAREEKAYSSKQLMAHAEELGIVLTKSQKAKLA